MQFDPPLIEGRLIRRYKRFLADVTDIEGAVSRNADDGVLTIHCPNTGSMTNCCEPHSRVWFWDSANPKRKYAHSWELVEVQGRYLACVNTGRANQLVAEAVDNGTIAELQGYSTLRSEVRYGDENSRIDLLLESDEQRCYVEVKNVTLLRDEGLGVFPDAVTERGRKHLRELMAMVAEGHRAVLLFCVAHTGIDRVAPADDIDPLYASALRAAMAAGVEVYAYRARIDPCAIALAESLPLVL